jgi:hypothetical protein
VTKDLEIREEISVTIATDTLIGGEMIDTGAEGTALIVRKGTDAEEGTTVRRTKTSVEKDLKEESAMIAKRTDISLKVNLYILSVNKYNY